jgi:ankyrin repeat protein
MLLEAGATVNVSRKDGVTPLHIAAQNGHRHICQLLMANPHGDKGRPHTHAHTRTHARTHARTQPVRLSTAS